MTAFVESITAPHVLPPWKADGVQTWLFGFPLATRAVTDYVDTFFNLGDKDKARYAFEAQAGGETLGTLFVSTYPRIASAYSGQGSGRGDPAASLCVSETQVSVLVPVRRYLVTADNMKLDPQIYFFQPFAISDNSYMVFANREIIGTDVMRGQISLRNSERNGMTVETVIPAIRKFSPRSKEEELPFLRVATGPPREQYMGTYPGQGPPWAVQTVALKQFRDTTNLKAATYQATVTSTVTYRNIGDVRSYQPESVRLEFALWDTVKEILTRFLDLQDLPDHPLRYAVGFTADVTLDQVATLQTFEIA
ncbi:MAG TPA: hypothetical protein VKQ54_05830 [Caulobacteraceae bacterium]|nr:hypothetical protein [Caulobacteraceae bacterium]